MARVVVTTGCTLPKASAFDSGHGGKPSEVLVKGMVLEVTAAQATAISTAGGATRAVSTAGMRDILGEAAAASNASA